MQYKLFFQISSITEQCFQSYIKWKQLNAMNIAQIFPEIDALSWQKIILQLCYFIGTEIGCQ